jgi:hypothetical protein
VHWNFPGAQTVQQAWGGRYSTMSSMSMVENESWNGAIPRGGSTTVGFLGTGTAPTALDNLMCMMR